MQNSSEYWIVGVIIIVLLILTATFILLNEKDNTKETIKSAVKNNNVSQCLKLEPTKRVKCVLNIKNENYDESFLCESIVENNISICNKSPIGTEKCKVVYLSYMAGINEDSSICKNIKTEVNTNNENIEIETEKLYEFCKRSKEQDTKFCDEQFEEDEIFSGFCKETYNTINAINSNKIERCDELGEYEDYLLCRSYIKDNSDICTSETIEIDKTTDIEKNEEFCFKKKELSEREKRDCARIFSSFVEN